MLWLGVYIIDSNSGHKEMKYIYDLDIDILMPSFSGLQEGKAQESQAN